MPSRQFLAIHHILTDCNYRYQDQVAFDSHMASPAVSALISLFGAEPTLLEGAPRVYQLHPRASFTRPEICHHENPHIVFAIQDCKPGTRSQGATSLSTVCRAAEENAPGTLSYCVLEDKENENLLLTWEVHENEKHLLDQVTEEKEESKSIKNSTSTSLVLKWVSGYMWKPSIK